MLAKNTQGINKIRENKKLTKIDEGFNKFPVSYPINLITYAYKKFFAYVLPEFMEPDSLMQLLSTDYKFAVSFSILVIVLLFRPSGIFKGKTL